MNESDLNDCSRRAGEELQKAKRATLPAVKAAHHQLADFHLRRAEELRSGRKAGAAS